MALFGGVRSLGRRLAACGCILVAIPGLFWPAPLLAQQEGLHLELRIDVANPSIWRVDWQLSGADFSLSEPAGEPFLHEGLAGFERLGLVATRQAALGRIVNPDQPRHDGAPVRSAPLRRGAFRLHARASGLGLDQFFAFHAPARPMRVRVEIHGLAEPAGLEFSGFETDGMPDPAGIVRLEGSTNSPLALASPMRLHLSSHRDLTALGEAILAPFAADKLPGPEARPPSEPDRDWFASIMRDVEIRVGAIIEPQLPRSIAHVMPGTDRDNRLRGPLDRAVLLRNELARHGLASRLVFTNRRPVVALPFRPAFLFDTVLVEVPEAELLLDPLLRQILEREELPTAFGHRATLQIEGNRTELGTFRPPRPEDFHLVVRAELSVDHRGDVEGQSVTEARGSARFRLAQLTARLVNQPDLMQKMLQRQGFEGRMRLGAREEDETALRQHLSFQYAAKVESAGEVPIGVSAGPRLYRAPLLDLLNVLRSQSELPISCHPLRLEQQIVIHLPDGRTLLDIPADIAAGDKTAAYEARYRLDGNHLHIDRRLEFDPPGPLCSKEFIREMAPVLRSIGRDINRALNLRRAP
jgi:hypothetical protein